jgi:adenosylcobinamide-phosphate synthase
VCDAGAGLRKDRTVPFPASAARPTGIALGVLADVAFGDPRRYHPVAGFGRAAAALERRWYADDVRHGAVFGAVAIGVPVLLGAVAERVAGRRPVLRVLLTAAATWSVIGGTSLAREGQVMAGLLERADLPGARQRLSHLCARDPAGMQPADLARATVESLAENASDAVVAPLLWGAVAGVPGLLGYRAANTLDAMVGYRSPRYLRFGRACARFDDVVNLVPARVTGALVALAAPVVGGSPARSWRTMRRDGARHPSPNAGRPEAAAAGALGVALGGRNVYSGYVEDRAVLGDGGAPQVADVRRAVRLGRAVTAGATAVAVAVAAVLAVRRSRGRGRGRMNGRCSGVGPPA